MNFEYKEEKNNQAIHKINEMLVSLPKFCSTYVTAKERSHAPLTVLAYLQRFDVFFRYLHQANSYFGEKPITEITLDDIDNLETEDIEQFTHWIYTNKIGKSGESNKLTTVDNYISALNSLWSYFYKHGKLKGNPVSNVERSRKQPHEIICLNSDQKDGFLNSVKNGAGLSNHQMAFREITGFRDYVICMLLLDTGIRVSELVGLNVTDVDLDEKCLRVLRKRSKIDNVYFSDKVAKLIREYIEFYRNDFKPVDNEDALFLVGIGKYQGNRLSVRSVEKMVKKYAIAGAGLVGPDITPHKLRATFATDSLAATNGNLDYVRKALSHESANTTLLYAKSNESIQKDFRGLLYDKSE